MFAQNQPGRPTVEENAELREMWFDTCLRQLVRIYGQRSDVCFAFPHQIGCGLARGNWDHYLAMIEHFALQICGEVYIVKPHQFF